MSILRRRAGGRWGRRIPVFLLLSDSHGAGAWVWVKSGFPRPRERRSVMRHADEAVLRGGVIPPVVVSRGVFCLPVRRWSAEVVALGAVVA
jgi:hypothetical protein